jgi:hypothetical protein
LSAVFEIVAFLLWVNFLPPLFNLILGNRFNWPLDRDLLFIDHRPILGKNKTFRGILCSLLGGIAAFPLLGIVWWSAGLTALLAMAGDLLSSFIKRRFNISSGKTVAVLDQIFESLFPILYLRHLLQLTGQQMVAIVICFVPVAYLGAWFWNYINYRPPLENYPRIIRSTVRFREWRACHSHWHAGKPC